MTTARQPDWHALDALLRRDPGGRGVVAFQYLGRPLADGQLEAAATSLAERGAAAAIVTGFAIVNQNVVAAETDGPPGALYLARALLALGMEVTIISDRYGLPLLEAGRRCWGLDAVELTEFPLAPPASQAWIDGFLASPRGGRLTHLISIERAGPSHTSQSLALQTRGGPPPSAEFEREVPREHRDRCHNMRGESIDAFTAPTHRLFEAVAASRPEVKTIGVADGGNEIGMGAVPWELLCRAIALGPAGQVACRVATDYLILAGISNWGAYALAAATAALRHRGDLISAWDAESQRRLIESLIHDAGAVDGVTGLNQASIDGLALDEYLRVLSTICRAAR
ncbi:MAG TPA: glutamate cyclase domain-containing protein [Pirellulales bacterium]|jgi:hypothetical protein|nr:glutamate cyclase domain-containing protein [Pirellulales bacterium]